MLGSPDAGVIKGAELSARTHDIPYEYLSKREISARFPALKPGNNTVGILEKNAGILFPEDCIKAHLELAAVNGAEINVDEKVIAVNAAADVVEVETNRGKYTANKVIISTGAWISEFLPELSLPLTVERQVLYWFKTDDAKFKPTNLPVYIWE